MSTAATTTLAAPTAAYPQDTSKAAPAPRFDFYTTIHKALRAQMCDTLVTLGAADAADDAERVHALDKVDALLLQMRSHIEHENQFVHTAIEARQAGGARQTAGDHVEHLEAITNLQDQASALRDSRPEHRAALALNLYRHLGGFVAENLEHMLFEERSNNATLWAHYSDAELVQAHDALLASIPPAEMLSTTRWLVVALPVAELAFMFADVRGKAPAPVFDALVAVARCHMNEPRFAKLAQALGLPLQAA